MTGPSPLVHVLVPDGINDPRRPSGGNAYDRRLIEELSAAGWQVREHVVPGGWPMAAAADAACFDALLADLPDQAVVLVDGLIASGAPSLVRAAVRLRIVVLVHMPDATEQVESDVLHAAAAVITTSRWSRDRVVARHHLHPDRVTVALPGVDPSLRRAEVSDGRNLLVVGPVVPAKGHDVLVAALAGLSDLDWHCTCVGALDLDPEFVRTLVAEAEQAGISERLLFPGPLTSVELNEARSHTDLMISASRREAYGMAVAEALAHGIPAVVTDVGGHGEAIGEASDGTVPGVLVPADDVEALTSALRRWLADPTVRTGWRQSAALRGQEMTGWTETGRLVAEVLTAIAGEPSPGSTGF